MSIYGNYITESKNQKIDFDNIIKDLKNAKDTKDKKKAYFDLKKSLKTAAGLTVAGIIAIPNTNCSY